MVEHQCPRCGREVELPFGALCQVCAREVEARARRVARRVALVTTVMLGLYIAWRVPPDPTARMVGGVAVVAWYILTRAIVMRAAREFLR